MLAAAAAARLHAAVSHATARNHSDAAAAADPHGHAAEHTAARSAADDAATAAAADDADEVGSLLTLL